VTTTTSAVSSLIQSRIHFIKLPLPRFLLCVCVCMCVACRFISYRS
jgi:hypothetical protein